MAEPMKQATPVISHYWGLAAFIWLIWFISFISLGLGNPGTAKGQLS